MRIYSLKQCKSVVCLQVIMSPVYLQCIYHRSDLTCQVKAKTLQPEPYYKVSALQVQLEESLIHNLERQLGAQQVEQLKPALDECKSLQCFPHGC